MLFYDTEITILKLVFILKNEFKPLEFSLLAWNR